MEQSDGYPYEVLDMQMVAKTMIHKERRKSISEEADRIIASASNSLQNAIKLVQKKGAYSWLIALPIEEYGFTLHKGCTCFEVWLDT